MSAPPADEGLDVQGEGNSRSRERYRERPGLAFARSRAREAVPPSAPPAKPQRLSPSASSGSTSFTYQCSLHPRRPDQRRHPAFPHPGDQPTRSTTCAAACARRAGPSRSGRRLAQGIPLAYVQEVCALLGRRATTGASARRGSTRFPQFKTTIDGLGIHFLHVALAARERDAAGAHPRLAGLDRRVPQGDRAAHRSDRPRRQGRRRVPRRVPALPGYGFSDKPTTEGWGVEQIATTWAELMQRLGYECYVAQGGDWGAAVTTDIAIQDTEHCDGIHLNMPTVAPDPTTMDDLTEREKDALAGLQVLPGLGLGLLEAAEHATADRGLRARRLARRTGGVDPREVLGVDRLQRPSRERAHARRDARQHHAVLAAGNAAASSARLYWESFTRTRATRSRSRPAAASSPRRSSAPRGAGPSAATRTSSTGTSSSKRRPLRGLRAARGSWTKLRKCFRHMRGK